MTRGASGSGLSLVPRASQEATCTSMKDVSYLGYPWLSDAYELLACCKYESILTKVLFFFEHFCLIFCGDIVQSGLGDLLHPLVSHFVTLSPERHFLVL